MKGWNQAIGIDFAATHTENWKVAKRILSSSEVEREAWTKEGKRSFRNDYLSYQNVIIVWKIDNASGQFCRSACFKVQHGSCMVAARILTPSAPHVMIEKTL